jgi:hypothetical protein
LSSTSPDMSFVRSLSHMTYVAHIAFEVDLLRAPRTVSFVRTFEAAFRVACLLWLPSLVEQV